LVSGSKFSNRPTFWWFKSSSCFAVTNTAKVLKFKQLTITVTYLCRQDPHPICWHGHIYLYSVWQPSQNSTEHENIYVYVQGDQKVSVHQMITAQKTHKTILNSFNHLPW
jgi:hypothetical protein